MKEIIKYLLLITILASCGNDKIQISKEEYNKLKGGTIKSKYPKPFKLYDDEMSYSNNEGIVLGSDGHEYLVIYWRSDGQSIMHYIECEKCFKKDTTKLCTN